MKSMIEDMVKKCSFCQKYKINHCRQYGHQPPKNVQHLNPSDDFHVDMIGPYQVIINKFEYQLRAVTYIDANINLSEVIRMDYEK